MIDNYKQAEEIIEHLEVNDKVRNIEGNIERVQAYWNIGKLIVESQGFITKEDGNIEVTKAKYGDNLIKEWSKKLVEKFGNNYDYTNLRRFRKFFLIFPKSDAVRHELNWTHYRLVLKLENPNERNYYINQTILNNLSTRELDNLIKSNAFERLSYADKEHIELIDTNNYSLTIEDMIKDPILIKKPKEIDNLNEKAIHKLLIDMVEDKFLELGTGFALIGHEYKISVGDRNYRIDLLFFNYKLNCFIVLEIKTRENQSKDFGQLKLYMNYVDTNIKEINHNKTIGIILVPKENKLIAEYIINPNVFITRYELV